MVRAAKNHQPRSVKAIRNALEEYRKSHSKASIEVKAQSPISVRIRIVDPDFKKFDKVDREELIWKILDKLPENVRADITMLLLITPEEKKDSFASFEFENPIPSRL
jgi:hypothetical protein